MICMNATTGNFNDICNMYNGIITTLPKVYNSYLYQIRIKNTLLDSKEASRTYKISNNFA